MASVASGAELEFLGDEKERVQCTYFLVTCRSSTQIYLGGMGAGGGG